MTRVAVVTGAARGLGRGIAVALAEAGCDVVVNFSTSADAAAETVALVEKAGARSVAVRGDIADVHRDRAGPGRGHHVRVARRVGQQRGHLRSRSAG